MTLEIRSANNNTEQEELQEEELVWIKCSVPMVARGLEVALRSAGYAVGFHRRKDLPAAAAEAPSCVIYCCLDAEDIASEVARLKAATPNTPIVVFGASAELPLARAALQAGAHGFLHAQMPPEQVVRALWVASKKGETVVPRQLLKAMVDEGRSSAGELAKLTPQKQKILELAAEGLSNAQIARRLSLTESTIKQHLRATYKVLGVRNRIEAAAFLKRLDAGQDQRGGPA